MCHFGKAPDSRLKTAVKFDYRADGLDTGSASPLIYAAGVCVCGKGHQRLRLHQEALVIPPSSN